MRLNDLHYSRAGLHFATAAVLVCGVYLGSLAGSGDFGRLAWVVSGLMLIIYPVTLQPFTWMAALLWAFLDFVHFGFGFKIANSEASLVFGALLVGTTWWRKMRFEPPELTTHWSFRLLKILLIAWLGYAAGHTIFNILNPFSPQDFSLKNLMKTAVQWSAPFALLFYFLTWPPLVFRFGSNIQRAIARLLFVGLITNVLMRAYFLWSGQSAGVSSTEDEVFGVYIPYLDLAENTYATRFLGPFGALFYTVLVTSQWFHKQTAATRALCWIGIALSIIGAVLSGGRFTVAVAVLQIAIVLVVRKKSWVIFAGAVPAAILFLTVNLFSTEVREAPKMVSRSLQWMLINKDFDTVGDISSSTDWRKDVFSRAIHEWRSDWRIFWFGRATYSYSDADTLDMKLRGNEGGLETALRRGSTHNLLSDLLIMFGLTGAILFMVMNLALGLFLLKLWRIPARDDSAQNLALICLIFHIFNVGIGLIAGAAFPPAFSWIVIIVVTSHYFNTREKEQAMPASRSIRADRKRARRQPLGQLNNG